MESVLQQTHCDACRAPLADRAAYCTRCGARTRRAKRLVRFAVRLELVFIGLTFLLVFGFAAFYYFQ